MHFGHKITIALILFILLMATMVTIAFKQKHIFLVSDDYYSKEIAYQNEIDKTRNLSKLSTPVSIKSKDGKIEVVFPTEMINAKGKILFYRPSNANLDFIVPVETGNDGVQTIDVSKVLPGKWTLKLEWEKDGIGYQTEKSLVI